MNDSKVIFRPVKEKVLERIRKNVNELINCCLAVGVSNEAILAEIKLWLDASQAKIDQGVTEDKKLEDDFDRMLENIMNLAIKEARRKKLRLMARKSLGLDRNDDGGA